MPTRMENRLAELKSYAEKNHGRRRVTRPGESREFRDWRDVLGTWEDPRERRKSSPVGAPWQSFGASLRWVEHPQEHFREAERSEDGWYMSDPVFGEAAYGVVYRLTGKSGESRYLSGVLDPYNDGPALIAFDSIGSDDPIGARHEANRLAEAYAEDSREEYAKDQAEQRIAAINGEIAQARSDVLALIREVKADGRQCGMHVKRAITDAIRGVRSAQARLVAERERLLDNYWEAIDQC